VRITRASFTWIAAIIWYSLFVLFAVYVFISPSAPTSMKTMAATDLVTYIQAGQQHDQAQPLYLEGHWTSVINYRYHPIFAWAFDPIAYVDSSVIFAAMLVLQTVTYTAGCCLWLRLIFQASQQNTLQNSQSNNVWKSISGWLAFTLINAGAIGSIVFGNVTPTLVLLSALGAHYLLKNKPLHATIPGLLLALTKPPLWLFPFVFPFVLRWWRTAIRGAVALIAAYAVANAAYVLFVDAPRQTNYTSNYIRFLASATNNYPFLGTEAMFNTPEHSIDQTVRRYVGLTNWVSAVVAVIKGALCIVVLFAIAPILRKPVVNVETTHTAAHTAIGIGWVVYLLLSLLLPELQAVVPGNIIFAYLFSFPENKTTPWIYLYLLYSFFNLFYAVSFATNAAWMSISYSTPLALLATLLLLWGILRNLRHRYA
jgi:hypothetical protein